MTLLTGRSVLVYGESPLAAVTVELVRLLGADALVVTDRRALSRLGSAEVLAAVDFAGDLERAGYPIVSPAAEAAEDAAETADADKAADMAIPADIRLRLRAATLVARLLAAHRGAVLAVDGPALLGERVVHTRFEARDGASRGGSASFLRAADGWVALNLARPEDIASLPALVEQSVDPTDWPAVIAAFARRSTDQLETQATLLGLPLATVGGLVGGDLQARARRQVPIVAPFLLDGAVPAAPRLRPARSMASPDDRPVVVELASLWAGPLCGRLLFQAGCRVHKAESTARPDGARRGSPTFFAALNNGKEPWPFNHEDLADIDRLRELIASADVVIDGSRPRVMDGWAIDRDRFVARGGQWVSITGYGATGPWANRVAFGDDAAASAGLVEMSTVEMSTVEMSTAAGTAGPLRFVGDAIADPISGVYAAVAALAALAAPKEGRRGHHIDVALREAAAFAARPFADSGARDPVSR